MDKKFLINKKKYSKVISKYKDMRIHKAIYLINKFTIALMVLFTTYAIASPISFTIKEFHGNIIRTKKDYQKIINIDLIIFIILIVTLLVLFAIDKKKNPGYFYKEIGLFQNDSIEINKDVLFFEDVDNIENTDDYCKFTYNGKEYLIIYECYEPGLQDLLSRLIDKKEHKVTNEKTKDGISIEYIEI